MVQTAEPTIEVIADTALIVRVVALSATHTITIGTFFPCDATSGAFTVTLPPASANEGRIIIIKKKDVSANAVTVARAGSDTIDGQTSISLPAQYDTLYIVNDEDGDIWNIIAPSV